MKSDYFNQFDEDFFRNLESKATDGEESFFGEIDRILTFSIENHAQKVYVNPKSEDITCDGLFDETEFSAREAFDLALDGQRAICMSETLFNRRGCVRASWIFRDRIGKPYYKSWMEIINVYKDSTEPIVYTGEKIIPDKKGELENQEKAYRIANGILGLEDRDEELKAFFDIKGSFQEEIATIRKRWGAI